MHSFTAPAVVMAAIVALPAVSAHGHISGVVSGGTEYPGADIDWVYSSTKPQQPGWFSYNQDNGFVSPSEYSELEYHVFILPVIWTNGFLSRCSGPEHHMP